MPISSAIGEGERLSRARDRQVRIIKGSLFAAGIIAGAIVGYLLAANSFSLDGTWPPAVGIALTILYLVAIGLGSVLLHKQIDEVERMGTYKAITVAGTAYMIGYPVWFLLWKSALLPEPVHWILFLAFWALLMGSALYYRAR